MKMTNTFKRLSFLLCVVLLAVAVLAFYGCDGDQDQNAAETTAETTGTVIPFTIKGEGAVQFFFTVRFADGSEKCYDIRTDKTTVGDALQELGLIAGEVGTYGLYVKTVDGVTVDYDTDGKYWAFYVNGAYGATGVDQTDIKAGATYSFRVE